MPAVAMIGLGAALVARFVIGSVLLLSGLAKMLASGEVMRKSVRNFGLPQTLSRAVAHVLPSTEVVVGLALLAGAFMPWPSYVASMLLVLFAVGMSVNLAAGKRFECGCFGSTDRGMIGWHRVALNVVLAAGGWLASGIPWNYRWRWPIAVGPVNSTLSGWEAAGAVLNAVGILVCWALVHALASLRRAYPDSSIADEIVEVTT